MSTARQLTDNTQGTGGLKLKIRFSESSGFVSDFVAETFEKNKHTDGHFASFVCNPAEQHLTELAQNYSHKNESDLAHWNSINREKFVLPENTIDSKSVESVSDENAVNDSEETSFSDPQITKAEWHSSGAEIPIEEQQRSQQQVSDLHQHPENLLTVDHDPEQTVNYGQVLEDLQFLSSRQDEPDGGGGFLPGRQSEQHLTVTLAPSQDNTPDMAERGVASSVRKEQEKRGVEPQEKDFEDRPVSPFDINCSLGLADEDFMLSSPSQKPTKGHIRNQLKENPVFPWSVVDSTDQSTSIDVDSKNHRRSVPSGSSCPDTDFGISALANSSVVSGLVQNQNDQSRQGNSKGEEGSLKRVIVVDCRSPRGSVVDSEINNNMSCSEPTSNSSAFDFTSRLHFRPLDLSREKRALFNNAAPAADTSSDFTQSSHSSSPLLEYQQNQKTLQESGENDTLTALLAHKNKTPNALRDNISARKSADTSPGPRDAVGVNQLTDHTQSGFERSYLNFTIDQLNKQREGEVIPKNVSPLHRMWQIWCRCETPDPEENLEEDHDLDGNKVSSSEICRKCLKKLSKNWKRKMSRQKRKALEASKSCKNKAPEPTKICCRCQPPQPYVPEGRVEERCKKCQKRVSDRWKRRACYRWCKCAKPVMHQVLTTDKERGEISCKQCQKPVSKDVIRPQSGVHISQPIVTPVMVDHTYSRSPLSSEAASKTLMVPVGVPCSSAQLQSAQSQNVPAHTLIPVRETSPSSSMMFLVPQQQESGQALQKSCASDKYVFMYGSKEQSYGMGQLSTSGKVAASRTFQRSSRTPTPEPSTNLQIDCITEPPTGDSFFTSDSTGLSSTSCRGCGFRATTSDSAIGDIISPKSKTSTSPRTGKIYRQANWPPLLCRTRKERFPPCFVVLEKMNNDLPVLQTGASCTRPCRQQALAFLCKNGNLRRCKHSVQNPVEEKTDKRLAIWNKKRDLLRRNRLQQNCGKCQQQEYDKGQIRCEGDQLVLDGKEMSELSASSFISLSSLCEKGTTNLHISQEGITVRQSTPKPRILPTLLQRKSTTLTTSGKTGFPETTSSFSTAPRGGLQETPVVNAAFAENPKTVPQKKAKRRRKEPPEGSDFSTVNTGQSREEFADREDGDNWIKVSKFNVRYYVFQCGKRAFLVPLIRNNRSQSCVSRLDEEDLAYVKSVISQRLVEVDSCARHLKYPDCLQHKGLRRTVTQCANVEESSSKSVKKAFVAPTLGAEQLDIEGLKSMISDKDFSRLVPQNSRLSKSRYLQQIGEKVHMYLTGGSEESPEWIKDVAKSIVMKQRNRVQSQKRLKPSTDITIEIDYAQEEEFIDVGEDNSRSIQGTCAEEGYSESGAPPMLADSSAAVFEEVDPTNLYHEEFTVQHDPGVLQMGSYVCEEAYEQERKPLVGELIDATHRADVSATDGITHVQGQQIMVPLPQGCGFVQKNTADLSTSATASFTRSVQLPPVPETAGEDLTEKKPLLGELLAMASNLVPLSAASTTHLHPHYSPSQQQPVEQHADEVFQPAEKQENQQYSTFVAPFVKEEPPDEDFSHAWPNEERQQTVPFISNSTFGPGIVHLDEDSGRASADPNQTDYACPPTLQPVKMERIDAEQSNAFGIPVITCVTSGETAARLENDHNTFSTGEENSSVMSAEGEIRVHFLPQITAVASGEAAIRVAESHVRDPSTDTIQSASAWGLASVESTHAEIQAEKQAKDFDSHEDLSERMTFQELVSKLVDQHTSDSFSEQSQKADADEQNQDESGAEQSSFPQISSVTFGEAAMMWEQEDSDHVAMETELSQHSFSPVSKCLPDVQPKGLVISTVVGGDAVVSTEGDTGHQLSSQCGSSDWPREAAYQGNDEDHAEGFEGIESDGMYEEEDKSQQELKPVMADIAAGRVVSIPIIFPSNTPDVSNAAAHQPQVSVPIIFSNNTPDVSNTAAHRPQVQIGVNLSLIKQESKEIEDHCPYSSSLTAVSNSSLLEGASVYSNEQSERQNAHTASDEVTTVPTILEVKSLAPLMVKTSKETKAEDSAAVDDLLGVAPEVPSISPVKITRSKKKCRFRHSFGIKKRQRKVTHKTLPTACSEFVPQSSVALAEDFDRKKDNELSTSVLPPADVDIAPLLSTGEHLSVTADVDIAPLPSTGEHLSVKGQVGPVSMGSTHIQCTETLECHPQLAMPSDTLCKKPVSPNLPSVTDKETVSPNLPSVTDKETVSPNLPSVTDKETVSPNLPSVTDKETVSPNLPSVTDKETVSLNLPSVTDKETVSPNLPSVTDKETVSPNLPSVTDKETVSPNLPSDTDKETVSPNLPSVTDKETVSPNLPSVTDKETVSPNLPSVTDKETVSPNLPSGTDKETVSPNLPSVTDKETVSPNLPPVTDKETVSPNLPSVTDKETVSPNLPSFTDKETVSPNLPSVTDKETVSPNLPSVTDKETVSLQRPAVTDIKHASPHVPTVTDVEPVSLHDLSVTDQHPDSNYDSSRQSGSLCEDNVPISPRSSSYPKMPQKSDSLCADTASSSHPSAAESRSRKEELHTDLLDKEENTPGVETDNRKEYCLKDSSAADSVPVVPPHVNISKRKPKGKRRKKANSKVCKKMASLGSSLSSVVVNRPVSEVNYTFKNVPSKIDSTVPSSVTLTAADDTETRADRKDCDDMDTRRVTRAGVRDCDDMDRWRVTRSDGRNCEDMDTRRVMRAERRDDTDTHRVTRSESRPLKLKLKLDPNNPGVVARVMPEADFSVEEPQKAVTGRKESSVNPIPPMKTGRSSAEPGTAGSESSQRRISPLPTTITSCRLVPAVVRSKRLPADRSSVSPKPGSSPKPETSPERNIVPTSGRLDITSSTQHLITPEVKTTSKQRVKATDRPGCQLPDVNKTSLPGQSEELVWASSKRKRRKRRGHLTLCKKRSPVLRLQRLPASATVSSKDSSLVGFDSGTDLDEMGCSEGNQIETEDLPIPLKKQKGPDVPATIASFSEDSPVINSAGPASSFKRKLDELSSAVNAKRSSKALLPKRERSMFSDMSVVLSKLSTCATSASSLGVPSDGSSEGPPLTVTVTKTSSDEEGLFARLLKPSASSKDSALTVGDAFETKKTSASSKDSALTVGDAFETKKTSASSKDSALTVGDAFETKETSDLLDDNSKCAQERSFFDCLPQGFMDAWKK